MSLEELMQAFVKLPREQQEVFVSAARSIAEDDTPILQAQIAECKRRLAAFDAGEMSARPLEEFLAEWQPRA